MLGLILAAQDAAAPLSERIPKNTAPGIIFTSLVCGACILWCVYVWYKHYGPGATPDDAERF